LRYKYGIFQQLISPEGNQLEAPDPWLGVTESLGIAKAPSYLHVSTIDVLTVDDRLDVIYDVRFYGEAPRSQAGAGRAVWSGGQEVLAIAYDVMIPGFGGHSSVSFLHPTWSHIFQATKTTNNLWLWESKPKRGFDSNGFIGKTAPLVVDMTGLHPSM
jgi:glycogen phosphorylase